MFGPARAALTLAAACALALGGCSLALGYPDFGAETCGSVDGDGDGLVGCADPDCDATCGEHDATTCRDGRDNDHDGLVDGLDVGCWTSHSIAFDRCATVTATDVDAGAVLGVDWTAEPAGMGTEASPPTAVTTPLGPGLEGTSPRPSNLLSVTRSSGASAPATVTVELAVHAGGDAETYVVIGDDLPRTLFVGSGVSLVLDLSCDPAGTCGVSLTASNTASPVMLGTFSDTAWHAIHVRVDFAEGSAPDAPSVSVSASMDASAGGTPQAVALPSGWSASAVIDVGLVLAQGFAVLSTQIQRRPLVRCGRRDPDALPVGSVVSGVWSPDGICVLTQSFDGTGPALWTAGVDPAHRALPVLTPVSGDSLHLQRLRAIAWDDVRAELVGVLTADGHASDRFVTVSPTIAHAPSCDAPWVELGPMFDDPGIDVPTPYIGSRGDDGAFVAEDLSGSGAQLRGAGDFGTPGSFRIVDRTPLPLDATSVVDGLVRVGDDWIVTRQTLGRRMDLFRLSDGFCDGCALASVLPSHEIGTFDARFVGDLRSSAIVMAPPPPSPTAPWDGLFFYHGEADGLTWLRIQP